MLAYGLLVVCLVIANLLVTNFYLDWKEGHWLEFLDKRYGGINMEYENGLCMKSDRELIRSALLARCKKLERVLKKDYLSPNERAVLQDEYERTFALTEHYKR